ncbi:unnamed protein product [Orchesella dallaii]|uniref:Protein kinase domain-containing protein n=1 Tax=Orchesella dallaii TaxID=48710 RepID=A0ABP1S2V8_9HEXA
MEEWERKIISKNIDKLINNTICNTVFLTKFQALEILSSNEVEELNTHRIHPSDQAYKFYGIIQGRKDAFVSLQQVLRETNQTGALEILKNECRTLKRKRSSLDDICSITYDLKTVLGKGSYGTVVYKGKLGERDVAVKLVHSDILDGTQAIHEVNILKSCDDHENIVRYFGSKESPPNSILIILELCDMSLKEWVKTKSIQISPLNILKQITVGLEWLHWNNILHRDLKPENILLIGRLTRVKITDFGLSRRIVDGRSCVSSSIVCGTQGWVAPEIIAQISEGDPQKCKFTQASDIFALGCLYYFVITDGKHPFGDQLRSQVNILDGNILIDHKHVLHGCSQNILFIKNMISRDPMSRPSCSALLVSPIFWEAERCVKFIEGLMTHANAVKEELMHFMGDAGGCKLEHEDEVSKLEVLLGDQLEKKFGCIVPFAYLNLDNLKATAEGNNECERNSPERIEQAENQQVQNSNGEAEVDSDLVGAKSDTTERKNGECSKQTTKQVISQNGVLKIDIETLSQTLQTQSGAHHKATESAIMAYPMKADNEMNHAFKIERVIESLKEMDVNETIGRLFQIVMTGDIQIVKGVLEFSCAKENITEIWDTRLKSLLHVAVEHREFPFVEYLVNHLGFAEVLSSPRMGDLIHVCLRDSELMPLPIFQDKFRIIQLLVSIYPALIESNDSHYNSPLHRALSKPNSRQLEVILMLIQNKANVNAQDNQGQSPLHYAVNQKPVPTHLLHIIKLLMNNKADPNLADKNGRTFLHCAAYNLSPTLYHDLVVYLVSVGKTKVFRSIDSHGSTVLHFAVYFMEPFYETFELFKENGTDFNAVDEHQNSVVFYAIKGGRNDTFLNILFAFGADWRILNKIGDTALHCAAQSGNVAALKLFISLGYDIDMTNSEWETALHKALEGDNEFVFEVVSELVNKNGACVGAKNKEGITPIDLARRLNAKGKVGQNIQNLMEVAANPNGVAKLILRSSKLFDLQKN